MDKRNVLTSPRLKELKRRKRRTFQRKVFLFILVLIIVLIVFSYLSRNTKITISTVKISGNMVIDTESIQNIVNEKLFGYYLGLFPKTNFLLYPKGAIKNELTDKFKRLKNISFNLKNMNTLEVSVSEREALYTWCGVNLPILGNNEEKCYFLDKNGFVFDEAPYFSGEVYIKFYGLEDINTNNPVGSYFSQEIFDELILFKNETINMGLKPKAFYLIEDGDIKMLLPAGNTISQNPEIIFKADADFNKVAENLQTALTTEPLQSDFKNKYSSLLYIDLRFGNKVLFKFK